MHGIVVADGILRPPSEPSTAEAERFLDDAARMLPDAGSLDLIGQYMVKYVYDSPDPTRPLLIGNRDDSSDIHQTAHQTLATVANGVCRGDCDDLSEIYQDIAARQGKLGYVISLPGHPQHRGLSRSPMAGMYLSCRPGLRLSLLPTNYQTHWPRPTSASTRWTPSTRMRLAYSCALTVRTLGRRGH